MNIQMCLVLVLHFLPRMKCFTTFFVTIESNIRHTTHPTTHGDVLPQNVELNLTTCTYLHHFTFLLTLRENGDWTVPIFTQNGQQTRTFIKQMPENVGMYEGNKSVFILKSKHGKVVYCTGFFERHGYAYTLYTLPSNRSMSQFIMHRYNTVPRTSMQRPTETMRLPLQPQNAVPSTQHPLKMPTLDVEILKTATRRHRQSRQIRLYEIELLIVVDFSLFTQMSKNALRYYDTTEQNIETEEMVHEIMVIVNGIDARFRNIKGDNYMVDVVLAGIFIAQNSSASPWSESVKQPSASRPVVNEDSLKLFIEWTKMNQDILPDFDHAMAITAYNLRNKDNHKTLGLGYKQSMCTGRRYSIIEHHGNAAYVSYIATHELAHSLGAKHDGHPVTVSYGERTKSCQDNGGFIMGTTASSNPDVLDRSWHFSECSQLYFDFFIDHLNENRTNCMTSTNHQAVTSDPPVSIATRYTADEQCERTHGQGFVLDRVAVHSDPSDICRSLPCKNVITNIRINTLPLAGTRCGVGKMCYLGKCVEDKLHTGIQSMEDDCIFGDQPGSLRTDGLTCQHLKVLESAHECYTFTRECCDTCKFHLRRYTNIPNCDYGDRKGSCSARDCEGDTCCETCSLLQGMLPECVPQILNENVEVVYNTISPHHGTSAMFSCQKSGLVLTGNQTSVCLDGTWSSTSPHCVSGCQKPSLKDFAHAHLYVPEHFEQSDPVDPMSVMHFQCIDGFVLKGPPVVVCLPESKWNDSFPTCALEFSSLSTVDVLENTTPGVVIHTLSTGDVSSFFKLLYFSHPGLIVTKDGHVLVDDGHVIDYEHTRSYTMIVEATSVIDPRYKTKQRLTIKVKDVNEFTPEFSEDSICIEMMPPLTSDPLKRRVHATDLDLYSINITYGLERSIDYAVIDHVTGEITVSRANFLKQPDLSSLVFEVYAEDSGVPKLTGTCTIEISFGKPCVRNNIASGNTRYLVLCNCFTASVAILSFHFCFKRYTYKNG